MLKEWVKGDHLTLSQPTKNTSGAPRLIKTVILRPMTNDATRTSALLAGDAHIIDDVPVRDIARIDGTEGVASVSRPGLRLIYLQMDHDREVSPKAKGPDGKNPFRNVKVRKAVYLGIDEQAIVKHVMNGFAEPASQFYPSAVFGYDPDIKRPDYNPDKAKALLKEAGYPNGFEVTIDSPNDRYVNDDKISQAIASQLARIGIKTSVNAIPKRPFPHDRP